MASKEFTVKHGLIPATDNGAALGTASRQWSDLFLASGSVINFNDDITLTHATNFSGDSLTLAGGTFDASAIKLGGTALGSLYSPIAGSSSVTTLGTIGTGVWGATDVAVAHGGTGASTASAARSNLGITDTTPGGSNTEVQLNSSGAFGASSTLKYVAGTGSQATGLDATDSDGNHTVLNGLPATGQKGVSIRYHNSDNEGLIDGIHTGTHWRPLNIGANANVTLCKSAGDVMVGSTGNTHSANLGAGSDVFLTVGHATGGGSVELARGTDTDATWIGGLHFANTNNSSTGNNANSRGIASVIGEVETTDSNAGDDSGGHLVFYAKAEASTNSERMRISSTGQITFAQFGKFQYLGSMTATTTWTNIDVSNYSGYSQLYMTARAGFLYYVSFTNNNGATGSRSYGHVYYSGNEEGSSQHFRSTVTTPIANSSGYHGYANLSFRANPDNSKKLQVQRSANTSQGWVQFYHMSVSGSNQVLG